MDRDYFTHMHALVGHIEKVEDRPNRHPRSGKMCGKWKGGGKAITHPVQPIYPDLVLHASTHTNRGQWLGWLPRWLQQQQQRHSMASIVMCVPMCVHPLKGQTRTTGRYINNFTTTSLYHWYQFSYLLRFPHLTSICSENEWTFSFSTSNTHVSTYVAT